LECSCNAEQRHDGEHRRSFGHAAQRDREQQQRAEALERVAERDDTAPVAAVREMPCRQDECDERQELRQTDQPEIERITRNLVHLPADRDRLHLHRKRAEQSRDEIQAEIAVAQDRKTSGAVRRHRAAPVAVDFMCGRAYRSRRPHRCRGPRPRKFVANCWQL